MAERTGSGQVGRDRSDLQAVEFWEVGSVASVGNKYHTRVKRRISKCNL